VAYREIQIGDKICVLENCICVVLRPDGDVSRYIGEAIDVPAYSLVNGTKHHNSDYEHPDERRMEKALGTISNLHSGVKNRRLN
jgi:hypothetical protein